MSSSSSLYGAPRPKSKSNAISLSSTSIHALSTELSLARSRLSSSTSKSAPGRTRPSKTKSLFTNSNKNVSKRAAKDLATDDDRSYGGKTSEELGGGVSERDLARSKKRLNEKAKLYNAMKRGDFNDDNGEGLVDFDRKWAEHPSDEESEDDEETREEEGGDEIVEYEDEFGRTRKGKKSEVEREKRREAAVQKAQEEIAQMNAQPEGLIIGNTIQTAAFTTATFSTVPSSSMLSSALPAESADQETHYDASKEVRTKGVGFYQFSKNAKERTVEMEELMNERKRTGEERKRKEEKKKRRLEELEARKEKVKRMRRGKVGESWLEGFMGEIEGAGGAGDEKEGGKKED